MQAVLRLVRVRDAREAEERGGRGAHSREAGVGGRARRGISDERGSRGGPRRARDGCETGEHAARACASPSLRGFEWCSPPMMTWPPDLAVRSANYHNSEHNTKHNFSLFFGARVPYTKPLISTVWNTVINLEPRSVSKSQLSSDCLLVPLRFFKAPVTDSGTAHRSRARRVHRAPHPRASTASLNPAERSAAEIRRESHRPRAARRGVRARPLDSTSS